MPLLLLLSACFLTRLSQFALFVVAGLFVTHVTHLFFSCLHCLKLASRCGVLLKMIQASFELLNPWPWADDSSRGRGGSRALRRDGMPEESHLDKTLPGTAVARGFRASWSGPCRGRRFGKSHLT